METAVYRYGSQRFLFFRYFYTMDKKGIPLFTEINQLHEATGYDQRTHIDDFHIFTMESTYPSVVQSFPPFKIDFFHVALLDSFLTTNINLNSKNFEKAELPLFFVVPGQTFSWFRGQEQLTGYILFFKMDFLPFGANRMLEEFPFLQFVELNVFNASTAENKSLRKEMQALLRTFQNTHPYQERKLQGLLLSFLYSCKAIYDRHSQALDQQSAATALTFRFQQLVNKLYCTMKSVSDFAEQLNVTPNYLTTAVKEVTGKSAKDLINERLFAESKNLLLYTDKDISEIGYMLNYTEPTHFARFFKKMEGSTPNKYRQTSRVHGSTLG
ncbi:MAG: AraC family transcriptional regulator [Saonia sp.]